MKFIEFGLTPSLQDGIDKMGFSECTPIQEACIGHVLNGRDIAGLAQTGTGKTAAFLVPLMERILQSRNADQTDLPEEKKNRRFPGWNENQFILVLVPTRELAEQIQANVVQLQGDSNMGAATIIGGVAYEEQKKSLSKGVVFVIATPGRLIDLYKEHLIDLRQVRAVVFDEADRMFDMGFKDDMKYILQRIPKQRQFLVFSATLNFDVLNIAYQFGADPIECSISRDQAKAENVKDQIFHIGKPEKPQHLLALIKRHQPGQVIIFSNFKTNVNRIAQFLVENGCPALGISSLLTQAQRTRVMDQFRKENDSNILVATDVAARGLDIKGVDVVINYELPEDPENYVHRIGRTGRAGQVGFAYSLVSDQDVEALNRIEEYLKHKLETGWIDDEHLLKDFKPMKSEYEHRMPPFRKTSDSRFDRSARRPKVVTSSERSLSPNEEKKGRAMNSSKDQDEPSRNFAGTSSKNDGTPPASGDRRPEKKSPRQTSRDNSRDNSNERNRGNRDRNPRNEKSARHRGEWKNPAYHDHRGQRIQGQKRSEAVGQRANPSKNQLKLWSPLTGLRQFFGKWIRSILGKAKSELPKN